MAKYILTIILILALYKCFSQNNIGIVTYKKQILEYLSEQEDFIKKTEKRPKYYNNVLTIDLNTKQLLKDVNFYLKFNKDEAIFEAENILEIENNNFYKMAIGTEGSIIYYTNQKNKENIKQTNAYGELFLVEYPMQEWELVNETKKIGEYTCYKATTIKTVKGRKGIINTPIEAWYTPEIAIPFGPLGYYGLPGLIIELSMYNYKYCVSKTELNSDKEINIKKPTQGKIVTNVEFEEIGLKAMSEFKKGF